MAKRNDPDPVLAEQTRVALLADLRQRLGPLRAKAAAKLLKLVGKPPPKRAGRLRFELHDVSNTFSVVVFAEDDSPGGRLVAELFSDAAIPGGTRVDWDGFWKLGVDPWEAVRRAVVELVAAAWSDAGGHDYPLPAVIGLHDDDNELDLRAVRAE